MTVIYVISKYIIVIGSILKGFWEHLFCRILGVPVSDARYLQATELCGHVEHDFTKTKAVTFFLNYLPGMMNRMFGYGMIIGGYLGLFYIKAPTSTIAFWFYVAFYYLGVSLLCNNAPLYEDALNNWDLLYGKGQKTNIFAKIFGFIPSVYFIVSAWLEKNALGLVFWIAATAVGIFVL